MSDDNKNNNKKPELVKPSKESTTIGEAIHNSDNDSNTREKSLDINKSGERQRPLSIDPGSIYPIKKK
jgi:hypothetical protein